MSDYLLAIAIGPVQDFIAAARRTRDLWYGSKLLSDVSKAVAEQLKEEGVELIFPSAESLKKDSGDDNINIANQIVALARNIDADKIQALAKKAKEAAHNYWHSQVKQAQDIAHEKNGDDLIDSEIWLHQRNDVLELYAAWVPLENDEKYTKQRERLMALLNARKHTRNFRPGQGFVGVRKSLLDGARESVLPKEKLTQNQIEACYRLGIKVTSAHYCEPLDLTGVVKRAHGSKMGFPSVARIAADSWIRKLEGLKTKEGQYILEELCKEAEKIQKYLISRIDVIKHPHYRNFPFDGTLFYLDRYPSILIEADEANNKTLEGFRQRLAELIHNDEPSPYLAIISADGDRMGEVLKNHAILEDHQAISRQLAAFSSQARQCVEKHFGACIYAGGDDVLALVPLNQALPCARALHSVFDRALRDYCSSQNPATLSVGIAVGHFMESLHDLRELAKEAEHCAKGDERNGLSIIFQPRGGNRYVWRESWSRSPDQHLQDWIGAFDSKALPSTLPYDLARLLDVYEHFQEPLVEDARRLPKVKATNHAKLLDRINKCSTKESMQQLIDELLLASRLANLLSGGE